MQCIARDVDGKREVAGVHWDYDCYGAPGKIAQVWPSHMPLPWPAVLMLTEWKLHEVTMHVMTKPPRPA